MIHPPLLYNSRLKFDIHLKGSWFCLWSWFYLISCYTVNFTEHIIYPQACNSSSSGRCNAAQSSVQSNLTNIRDDFRSPWILYNNLLHYRNRWLTCGYEGPSLNICHTIQMIRQHPTYMHCAKYKNRVPFLNCGLFRATKSINVKTNIWSISFKIFLAL